MRLRARRIAIALALAASLLVAGCNGSGKDAAPPPLSPDASAALQQATMEGKPVFLSFETDDCQACTQLRVTLNSLQPSYEGVIVFIQADAGSPQNFQLAEKFNVQRVPTSITLDATGQVRASRLGAIPAEELRALLNDLAGEGNG